ncbi:tryptophan 2,3-dioxygenase family protein [Kutzneria buriramensis]|uniref:Tryptophan 2,3-dioxygenase n=1 Tax=Kutzneria buriramensis TaxID=1045776 RepID=A0A3E0GYD8_9PSEU|nr:tryptophan 2,3-dioxygenase family protein [Kutzneria buriramensis]REH34939.1 tryptophan 2,3-dioxygenase [Kutzneria buriramensis]
MTAVTYSGYLRLTELLSLQQPRTPADRPEVRDSERLFIVVHQASEILLSQALADLRQIVATGCRHASFAQRVERVTWLVDTLVAHLALLRGALPSEDFLVFRDRLGTASGAQSVQFQQLFRLTDVVVTANDERHAASDHQRVARLAAAVRRWRTTHLEMVADMIGNRRGTGDTAGVRYLAHQMTNSPLGARS